MNRLDKLNEAIEQINVIRNRIGETVFESGNYDYMLCGSMWDGELRVVVFDVGSYDRIASFSFDEQGEETEMDYHFEPISDKAINTMREAIKQWLKEEIGSE